MNRKYLLPLAIIIPIAAILTLGVWELRNHQPDIAKIPAQGSAAYVNEPTTRYTFKRFSIQKIEELGQYSKSDSQVEFYNHYYDNRGKRDPQEKVVYMSIAYAQYKSNPTTNDLIGLNANLQNPTYKGYAATIAPIKKFVADRLKNDPAFSLTNGRQFKNVAIKNNAWQFDLSASDPSKKNVPVKGTVLYFVQGRNQYYFVLYSAAYDWSLNQSVFQMMINSIEVS